MRSRFVTALFILVFATGAVRADLIEGVVRNVDVAKNTITVFAKEKDQSFLMAKNVKVLEVVKPAARTEVAEFREVGVGALKEGMQVTLTRGAYKLSYVITSIVIGQTARDIK